MKQITFVMAGLAIFVLIVLGVLTISHRHLRENEMENALSDTVRSALDDVVMDQDLDITDEDALAVTFYESLLQRINAGEDGDEDPNFELQADVTGIDAAKGILSVHVEEKYTKPNGKTGEVKCDATASFDQKKTLKRHTVTFYIGDEIWKLYEIKENEAFVEAAPPEIEGQTFLGWTKDPASKDVVVFPAYVTEDAVYHAIFQ